jgi:hypothetical protein
MRVHYLPDGENRWPACGIIIPVAMTRDPAEVTCAHCRKKLGLYVRGQTGAA